MVQQSGGGGEGVMLGKAVHRWILQSIEAVKHGMQAVGSCLGDILMLHGKISVNLLMLYEQMEIFLEQMSLFSESLPKEYKSFDFCSLGTLWGSCPKLALACIAHSVHSMPIWRR